MGHKKRGFTLVECVVVIGITAVLVSVFIPSMARKRQQARSAVCQSYLKQWGVVFSMYANENDGLNHNFWPGYEVMNWSDEYYLKRCAVELFKPIYGDERLLMCPAASVTGATGGTMAWVNWQLGNPNQGATPLTGSYGENMWTTNPIRDIGGAFSSRNFWNKMGVAGADRVPLFMDSRCPYMFPMSSDMPPATEDGQFGSPVAPLKYPCVNRHGEGTINMLFLDSHVRKVGLKELWQLKWSPTFNTSNTWTTDGGVMPERWPLWMQGFKDY